MKPAPFAYVRPVSLSDAVECLVANGDDAKVLGGGQSLIPLLAFRLVRPSVLVDLGAVPGLDQIVLTGDRLVIGARATHRAVELDEDVRRVVPMVTAALGHLGHVAIRNAGTVGGSIAHADPAAEWAAVALALDGSVVLTGPSGSRAVPVEDFFVDWMHTDLRAGEIVTALELVSPPAGSGWGFNEVARRHGDFGLAGAAVVISVADRTITRARVALLGLGLTPLRARHVEERLLGSPLEPEQLRSACAAVQDDITPLEDQHASVDYKRHLAGVVVDRAVAQAVRRTGATT